MEREGLVMNRCAARIGLGLLLCMLCGGAAADLSLEMTRVAEGLDEDGFLPPGANSIDFAVTLTATGDPVELTALAVEERLPRGFTYVSVDGDPAPGVVRFDESTGVLQFAWIAPPDSFPFTFRYRANLVTVPRSSVQVTGRAIYRTSGAELRSPVVTTTLNLSPCLTFTRISPNGCYTAGQNHEIEVSFESSCSEELTALGLVDVLPEGFTFVDTAGDDAPDEALFDEETNELNLLWIDVPAFPFSFTYVVGVPADQDGNVPITGRALYRTTGEELRSPEVETILCGEDTTPPVLTLLGGASITAECGQPFVDPGAVATDNVDGDLTGEIEVTSNVDTSELGTYQIVYRVSDREGNAAAPKTRTVVVADRLRPTITLIGEAEVTVECGGPYEDAGAFAEDLCEGTLGAVTGVGIVNTAQPDTYVITYDISDSEGNAATRVTRTVHVVDGTRPRLSLRGGSTVTVECGSDYVDEGANAVDACEGDLSGDIVRSGSVDTSNPAVYALQYDVADSAGNSAVTLERRVIVVDRTPPEILLLGEAEITVECGVPYVDAGATASDGCAGDLTNALARVSTVDISEPGVYAVTYNVSDGSGNEAEAVVRQVTVEDHRPPVIGLIGSGTVSVPVGSVYTDLGATATDACDGSLTDEIVVDSDVNVNVFGTYTVAYNVSDSSGNAAVTVQRTVRVVDGVPPVIRLLGDAQMAVDCGSGPFEDPGATATDNSDGDLTDEIEVTGAVDTSTPGSYTLRYDVRDSAGNAAIPQTRRVVVRNNPAQLSAAEILSPTADIHVPVDTESVQVVLTSTVAFDEDSGCPEGVIEMTYRVDGVEVGSSTELGRGFPVLVTLTPGQFDLECTAHSTAAGNDVDSPVISFQVVESVDADGNGIVDAPFSALREEGESWAAVVGTDGCQRSVRLVTWLGDCDTSDGAVTVAVPLAEDPGQSIVVSAPRILAACGEQAVLLVSIACDLESLLGGDVAGDLGAPPPNLVEGGAYFEVSVLIGEGGSDNFTEVDTALLEAHPVTLALSGLTLTGETPSTFYRHPTAVTRDAALGVQVVAQEGSWTSGAVTNVNETDDVLSAQTTRLSVFGPFAVNEDGPMLRVEPTVGGSFLVGSAAVGGTAEGFLTVRNVGTQTLEGTAALTNNPNGVFTLVGNASYSLGANEAKVIRVRFSPAEASIYTGSVRFTGGLNGPLSVQLRGNGRAADKPFRFLQCGGAAGTTNGGGGDMLAVLAMAGFLTVASLRARLRRG